MFDKEKIDELVEFFKGDKFATNAGCEILEVDEGYCKAKMTATDGHRNGYGGIMGGAIFTLADFAFAVACNAAGVKTLGLGSNISFVGNTKKDVLYATATCLKDGKSTCTYMVEVLDDEGRKIAYSQMTGFHLS